MPLKIGYIMQEGVEIRRPPFNGPANHVREVVQALGRRGHRVKVLARVGDRIWRSEDLESFQPVSVRWLDRGALRLFERGVRRVQSEFRLPYAALFESLRFARACVQEFAGFDLLYERLGWVAYGGALAARLLRVPLVVEDNGDHLFDLEAKGMAPAGLQRRLSVGLMRRAVGRAAHVVSTGAGWREQFIKRWNYQAWRVSAVENGTTLAGLIGRDQLRSFGEGDAGPVTLAYVGGFYPWHGVTVLLEAVSRCRAGGIDARLLMVGAGDRLPDARRQAAELGLNGAVSFAGHLEPGEYAPILARADIGVSPYVGWPEFSGLKVLDYKAAGLPTIASGVNGHPPTLRDGCTGIIVPPGNVEALQQAILRLSADPPLRRRMGQLARIEAETLHSWDHTAARLDDVFAHVIEGQWRG